MQQRSNAPIFSLCPLFDARVVCFACVVSFACIGLLMPEQVVPALLDTDSTVSYPSYVQCPRVAVFLPVLCGPMGFTAIAHL
jgi:hypothetical protein